jgi:hypothetical protein
MSLELEAIIDGVNNLVACPRVGSKSWQGCGIG